MNAPASLPPLRPASPVPAPRVDAATLPNGLEVQVVPWPGVPLVGVRLVVRGGFSDDAPGDAGLARLLAASLREGTATRSGGELADLSQEAGGDLSAGAGPDSRTIAASGLAPRLPLLLDLVADVARRPAFPAAGELPDLALPQRDERHLGGGERAADHDEQRDERDVGQHGGFGPPSGR